MPIPDKTLAMAIPQELKTDHPDSSLVVQGIIIALAACEDAPSFGGPARRMKAVHDALRDIYVPIVKAHLAKEDEDWSALKARAELAESEPVTINTGEPENLWDVDQWKGQASDGTYWLVQRMKESGETTAKIFSADGNSKIATASGDTAVIALKNAYRVVGKRAEVNVPEPAPVPTVEPIPAVIAEDTTDDDTPETIEASEPETYKLSYRFQRDGIDDSFSSIEDAKARAEQVIAEGNGPGTRRPLYVSLLTSGGKRVDILSKTTGRWESSERSK